MSDRDSPSRDDQLASTDPPVTTPPTADPPVLWDAEFDRRVKPYYLWVATIIFTLTIVGIPIAILYLLIGRFLIEKHLQNMSCVLTERTLEIKKGIFNKTESTIPLEKITDLQMFQGPIMRRFDIRGFKVETAGQSAGPGGSLVNITGIVEAVAFRRAVLEQRDRLATHHSGRSSPGRGDHAGDAPAASEQTELLREIRDALGRIETRLGDADEPT